MAPSEATPPSAPDLADACRQARAAGFDGEPFEEDGFLRLAANLTGLESVCVAYSGGVDSTFLLRVAVGLLEDKAIGVLGSSESLDRHEHAAAMEVAQKHDLPIRVIETHEYDNPAYRRNDAQRCFHCKDELFSEVRDFARREGFAAVADGSNADDVGDFRPGLKARNRHGVRSPLLESGLCKADIRRYSRALGLPTWDKPAAPCLSSRIPYGLEVTAAKLRQIEAAEKVLRDAGFRTVRLRHHGDVARIELPLEDLKPLLSSGRLEEITAAVKAVGFLFVTLDLEGFRSGSLNQALVLPVLGAAGGGAGSLGAEKEPPGAARASEPAPTEPGRTE